MNEFSLGKFAPEVANGGLILYGGPGLPADFAAPGVQVFAIPAAEIADKLGSTKASQHNHNNDGRAAGGDRVYGSENCFDRPRR